MGKAKARRAKEKEKAKEVGTTGARRTEKKEERRRRRARGRLDDSSLHYKLSAGESKPGRKSQGTAVHVPAG